MASTSDDSPIANLSRFEFLEEIGRGRMGKVSRLLDRDLGREVAGKIPITKFRSMEEGNRRFVREVQVTAQLRHPGVPPVHDLFRLADGSPIMIQELVNGPTLRVLLQIHWQVTENRFPRNFDREQLLRYFEMLGKVVAYAHVKGVIHRDLEPTNVIVNPFGEVQLVDWGLSLVRPEIQPYPMDLEEDARVAREFGNPAYVSPEQARGERVDYRTDLFSLGSLLCEILTGLPPFVGESNEQVAQKAANGNVSDAFARLDACGAVRELITLTKTCLCPDRENRKIDAHQLVLRVGDCCR